VSRVGKREEVRVVECLQQAKEKVSESWLKIKYIYIITSGRPGLVMKKGKEKKKRKDGDLNAYISGADSSTGFVDNTFA
jgi:hypothetical protein